ncbi:hypothetical protein DFH11DRAFT_713200 [Phellopilus nigrolimitatus]|nr:hypothetical protein DFH11DRAFT_713200 [Phellopilus nigrolimitatus]
MLIGGGREGPPAIPIDTNPPARIPFPLPLVFSFSFLFLCLSSRHFRCCCCSSSSDLLSPPSTCSSSPPKVRPWPTVSPARACTAKRLRGGTLCLACSPTTPTPPRIHHAQRPRAYIRTARRSRSTRSARALPGSPPACAAHTAKRRSPASRAHRRAPPVRSSPLLRARQLRRVTARSARSPIPNTPIHPITNTSYPQYLIPDTHHRSRARASWTGRMRVLRSRARARGVFPARPPARPPSYPPPPPAHSIVFYSRRAAPRFSSLLLPFPSLPFPSLLTHDQRSPAKRAHVHAHVHVHVHGRDDAQSAPAQRGAARLTCASRFLLRRRVLCPSISSPPALVPIPDCRTQDPAHGDAPRRAGNRGAGAFGFTLSRWRPRSPIHSIYSIQFGPFSRTRPRPLMGRGSSVAGWLAGRPAALRAGKRETRNANANQKQSRDQS